MGSYSRQTSAQETELFGTPPLDGWAESVCGPAGTPGIDDLLRMDPPEASNDDGLRSVLLAKAVEYEIIPRLMLAHRVARDGAAHPVSLGEHVAREDVIPFAEMVLHDDDAALRGFIAALRDRGVPIESVFLDLLAPVARYLGELWERDLCSFTEVTVGLGRLQQLLRENSAAFAQFTSEATSDKARRVLLMPCPGEQHTFGLSLVGEFFHRAGWEVVTSFVATDGAPGMVQKDWFDVVGFSLGCETGIERLGETMEQVRRKSLNPGISIIAGGAIFGLHPEFGNRLTADAIITDGPAAPALAAKLLADSKARSQV
ncbi:cobalamin B12-binding domain-containing protein [Hydrogenophaga sp. PBL-H3]|uniref:cobalamin B12-binding domain-containing protein n=1 Tax=Hydrogenophaga sp. PBL-H3 TaxID=434010 RepID=UPI00131F801F|nr:cobalamin-dependent protein [Hydrogenophaga sp. PBL-H3]QHE76954.1 cobalamin-binding protein [Hydrogenophaga sp. PBL-H3]QHE81377.1 cobalamin-binding protein [Hydrogenophaga sp. PBL-H3]